MICDHPPAIHHIQNDSGGELGAYLARAGLMRACGDAVQVSGYCHSACTFYLSAPGLCVRPGASFGFHEAYYPGGARLGPALLAATKRQMMDSYPPSIRAWLNRQGGLSPAMKILSATQAVRMGAVKACKG